MSSGLDLEQVLQHVVDAAATLLDAQYAALGVIGDDGMLSEFVTEGFHDEEGRIGHRRCRRLPRGCRITTPLVSGREIVQEEEPPCAFENG